MAGLASFLILTSCQSHRSEPAIPIEAAAPAKPLSTAAQPCVKLGPKRNFNDQRIVAFQKLVQLQILRIKALPMTEESTQELAQVEGLRRRVSYPLLTPSLRPQVVTKILSREAKNFLAFLEKRKKTDSQAQSLEDEINVHFLPLLENEEHWNCLEKPTDFQEDSNSVEKTE